MTELLDECSYDQAVAEGALIVNVDKPTKVVRLHQAPGECTGLRDGFVTKVVENRGKTGSYWAVGSETAARQRWGDEISVCMRCG
jgi:hypothetical protein